MYFQLLKIFIFDMLSLENIISDIIKCLKQAGKNLV